MGDYIIELKNISKCYEGTLPPLIMFLYRSQKVNL